jgi:hypothetical protein
MKVVDLQLHLDELKRLLEAAGTKGAILTDLSAIGGGLAPFRQHSLKEFADFLLRAEEFDRTGVVTVKPVKGKKPGTKEAKPKEPPPDASSLAQESKRLYEQAIDPAVTVETVDALVARVGKLKKPGLVSVATALELKIGSKMTMPAILEAIRQRILNRKGSWQRTGLLDRPTSPNPVQVGSVNGGGVGTPHVTTPP